MLKPVLRIKRRRRAAAWVRIVRRAHFLRMWSDLGSLYGVDPENETDPATWRTPKQLDHVYQSAGALSEVCARFGGSSAAEHPPFELEHLLSLGVLGLRRDPDGVIRSRFPRPTCRVCYGMTWRVRATRCDRCGLQHRQECA